MDGKPHLRIAVVHEDGTTAIYHVTEIRLEAKSYTTIAACYFTTIKPAAYDEERTADDR